SRNLAWRSPYPRARWLFVEVGREGHVARRAAGAVLVPGAPGKGVAGLVLPGGAEAEDDDRDVAAVRHLPAGRGADPGERPDRDLVLDLLDDQGERAGEDEVELFLALVHVDAHALARLQLEPVDAEALGAEVAPDRFEDLPVRPARLGGDSEGGEVGLGHRLRPRPTLGVGPHLG